MAASGSAGTLGAGDYLKERHGSLTVAVEALECPTMLYNGYGEHNIQGIGDKHIPLIHNVTNNDVVVAVSDRTTDALDVLFNTEKGAAYLVERAGVARRTWSAQLGDLGLSSICNVVAAIKLAKHLDLGPGGRGADGRDRQRRALRQRAGRQRGRASAGDVRRGFGRTGVRRAPARCAPTTT